jgi:hypothetical protein
MTQQPRNLVFTGIMHYGVAEVESSSPSITEAAALSRLRLLAWVAADSIAQ